MGLSFITQVVLFEWIMEEIKCDQSPQTQSQGLDEAVGEVALAGMSQAKHHQSQQAQNKTVEHNQLQDAPNEDFDRAQGVVMSDDESQVGPDQSQQRQKSDNSLKFTNRSLAIKAIHFDDPCMFVRWFENGMSPDVFTQRLSSRKVSLLRLAVGRKSYNVIKVLLDNDVNINLVPDNASPMFARPDSSRRSIMCSVLEDDDPTLMELLLPKYDRNYNWEGKSLLYMACQLGAYRCAEVLLQRYRGDTNLAEISVRDDMRNKAMIISVLCRTEGAVYTTDDLGFCLKEAVNSRNASGNSSLYNQYEGDRTDYVNLLLTCGANVNLELPSSRGNVTPLEELLYLPKFPGPPQFHRFVEKALSLLLSHGSIANWPHVNIMLSCYLFGVICLHEEEIRLFFLSIMSKLYSKEHFKQIKGPMVDCEIGQRSSEWSTLLQAEDTDVSSVSKQKTDCLLNLEIIRLAILYLNIDFHIHYYFFKVPRYCRCRKYFLGLFVSTLKDSDYQEFIKAIPTDNPYRCHRLDAVRCSNLRSLKERTRATILNSLCLPRSLSIKELPLPQCLQAYLCLKY